MVELERALRRVGAAFRQVVSPVENCMALAVPAEAPGAAAEEE